jgi:hypothetical protein
MSKNTYPEPSRRARGGQPGNQNARTHGFYSKTLSPEQQEALQDAAVVDGIDQEIALLRVKIASILENAPQNIDVLILALSLLARLLQTKQLIDKKDRHKLGEAFQNVLRNIAVPLGFTLSKVERPVLSDVEGPVLSEVEGLLPEGYLSRVPKGASPSLTNNESRSI